MDLDWLHAVIEGRCRFGRTFTMLVIAVQQADFVEGDLVIIGKHRDHVENLKAMFAKAAEDLEFTITWERPDRARINNATYHFRSATSPPESRIIPNAVFFYDQYTPLLEHVVETACMGYEIDFIDTIPTPKEDPK